MKRIRIIISGKVVSVFFRYFIYENANKLNIKGWVRNTQDEKVEALLEGDLQSIQELIKLCKNGPKNAIVDDIDIRYEKFTGEFQDFEIKY